MPVITVQLGQCGNQLGCSFFQSLASELGSGEYQQLGLEEWFRVSEAAGSGRSRYVARSVLIDMEPKVVSSVMHTAATGRSWWRYPADRQLCMSSGAGNNWAHGFHGYGPRVRDAALELVRREAEACDVLGGFLLLQSMAGGTGAGLGTYVAAALRDEYPSSHALNCCVWPYETGEVIVQAYNTLFTLSHLADVSDGIVLMENEALHRTAHRLYNIARPSFQDMNLVAARSLASLLLPSHHRPGAVHNTQSAPTGSPAGPGTGAVVAASGAERWLRRQSSSPGLGGGAGDVPGAADRLSALSLSATRGVATTAGPAPDALSPGRPMRLLPELVGHCAPHPGYRLMSLRAMPQVPAVSVDFTTFTWPAITKRLRQMMITGSSMEEGMDWGVGVPHPAPAPLPGPGGAVTPLPSRPAPGSQWPGGAGTPGTAGQAGTGPGAGTDVGAGHTPGSGGAHSRQRGTPGGAGFGGKVVNKSVSNWLVLRGQGAGEVDVSSVFGDPGLYASWSPDPLAVSYHPARFSRCAMAAAQLSADQACVEPCRRMQERAYSMWASRAYVHQYEKYGLVASDFENCFAHVEDIMERYASM